MNDMEFMEEILEKRSTIDESTDAQEIEEIKEKNDKIVDKYWKEISQHLAKKDYKKTNELMEKFQYYIRIDEAIQDWHERNDA